MKITWDDSDKFDYNSEKHQEKFDYESLIIATILVISFDLSLDSWVFSVWAFPR